MSSPRQTPTPDPSAPRALREVLLDIEYALRADTRRRAERAHRGGSPASTAHLSELAAELEACVAHSPADATRRRRRLRAVRAHLALHARDIPAGALAGLYEDVRAATDHASPWERARMSDAFLDAPRQLARWRGTALAACAVLALGAGLFVGGRLGFDDSGPQGLERNDPRNALLPRLESLDMLPDADLSGAGARIGSGTLVSDEPGSGDPGRSTPGSSNPGTRRLPRRRSAQSFYVFYGNPLRAGDDAARRLDAVPVRIFPVGAPVDDVEQN